MWLLFAALSVVFSIVRHASRAHGASTELSGNRSFPGIMKMNERQRSTEAVSESMTFPQLRLFAGDVEMLLLIVEARRMEIDIEIRSMSFRRPLEMHGTNGQLDHLFMEKQAVVNLSERLRLALMQEPV